MAVHPHSLELIEFPRVADALAARATSPRAHAALSAARPLADSAARGEGCRRLAEAIRRQREPAAWAFAAASDLAEVLAGEARAALEPEAFAAVADWLDAAARTRAAWTGEAMAERFPVLAADARSLPDLTPLRERIAATLDADGRVKDGASPALARARKGIAEGERSLHRQLERWAAGHGAESYVTRAGDRFVALVPAASFSRRQGIVHDTSNTGQSLFVEPLEACEANNRLIELRAEAAEEERRILRELAAAVRAAAPELEQLEATLAKLDAARACATWAVEFGGEAITPGGDRLRLVRARHPLLVMRESPGHGEGGRREPVVPLDVELGPGGRMLLVSGPNMGGKTVLLKTVGLAVALAHAALPVLAAEGSAIPELDELRADLGDEQSVDRGLSTFAAHLLALKAMAEAAGPRTLLLADELGAGTDPEEGAALGRALLEHVVACGAWGVVTTHLGSLKRVASDVPGLVNGSLEFDLETLTSRYRFRRGVPGASHALDVAGRLGFPAPLLERARQLEPAETRALERLLAEVGDALAAASAEREALEKSRLEAERAAAAHRATEEEAKRALAALRKRLTAESEALLRRTRELWQAAERDARKRERTRGDVDQLRAGIQRAERDAESLHAAATPAALGLPETPLSREPVSLAPGARVRVTDLGFEATLVSGPDAEGRVQLRRGNFSIQSHVSRLAAAAPERAPSEAPARGGSGPDVRFEASDDPPPLEADLRGLEVTEALGAVDHALDRAVLSGLHELRIIHGIGTGALRVAVQKHLKGHPQVESQRWGEGHEGGRGVTVARLR
jgi:DNA mismatch repair protein MutS2